MARMARDAGTWPDEQQEPAGAGRSRAVPWVATATGVVLLILAPRYGPHRDELYFVVAGHHPQRGYPDQPPLTPLLAAFLHDLAPGSLVALRSVSALLVVLVVWLAADLARAFGASRHGQLLSAVVVAVGPGVLSVGHLLSTSTLDLAVWVGVTRLAVAALGSGDRRWWLAAGLLLGVGLENKTLPAFLALGLVVGLAGSPRFRGHLASPWLWAAALVAVALWAPNLHWQATHGWPQLELGADIRAEDGGLSGAVTLVGFQLLLLGPIGGYLAVRGLGVGLRNRTGLVAPVATAYVVVLAVLLATGGKHDYTLGLLVALAAAGAARSSPALPTPAPGRPRLAHRGRSGARRRRPAAGRCRRAEPELRGGRCVELVHGEARLERAQRLRRLGPPARELRPRRAPRRQGARPRPVGRVPARGHPGPRRGQRGVRCAGVGLRRPGRLLVASLAQAAAPVRVRRGLGTRRGCPRRSHVHDVVRPRTWRA